MGGAFLARADDATAASWNPAGLSYLRRPEFSIVGARNSFDRGAFGDEPTDTPDGYTPDFVAVTYPLQSGLASQLSYQRVFSFRGTREIERAGTHVPDARASGGFDVLAFGSGWRVGRTLRVGGTRQPLVQRLQPEPPRARGPRAPAPSRTSTTTSPAST